jgi:hypothetical protein
MQGGLFPRCLRTEADDLTAQCSCIRLRLILIVQYKMTDTLGCDKSLGPESELNKYMLNYSHLTHCRQSTQPVYEPQ